METANSSNEQNNITSKQRLVQALREYMAAEGIAANPFDETKNLRFEAFREMLWRAEAGDYDDFESESPTPKISLVSDLRRLEASDQFIARVLGGEFDSTKEEGEAWFEREGRGVFTEMFASLSTEGRQETEPKPATAYRQGLPPRPKRMMWLPLDERGYPVPYFVQWIGPDGRGSAAGLPGAKPDFRIMDASKWATCVASNRCWLCGQVLGKYRVFVSGPMCGINRVSPEPPSHLECAEYAAKACPFLTMPKMVRNEHGLVDVQDKRNPGGIMITRNPGVAMLYITDQAYEVVQVPNGRILRMPLAVEIKWYAEGRAATRAEVMASIDSGLPLLIAPMIQSGEFTEDQAIAYMQPGYARLMTMLPAA